MCFCLRIPARATKYIVNKHIWFLLFLLIVLLTLAIKNKFCDNIDTEEPSIEVKKLKELAKRRTEITLKTTNGIPDMSDVKVIVINDKNQTVYEAEGSSGVENTIILTVDKLDIAQMKEKTISLAVRFKNGLISYVKDITLTGKKNMY